MEILDVGGAEKLPENADMLLLTAGMTIPQHIKGFHISDSEIDSIVQASGSNIIAGDEHGKIYFIKTK